jgi:two-component system, chemotaxis family, chemotaxis protein CheY
MARILIVDDVTPIRDIVISILQKRGHRIFEAKNAEEALGIAREKKVHMVLTDVNMPGMDGISMIEKMRVVEHYKTVPIVVLAKDAKDSNIERAKAAGAVDWVAKPFTEEMLVNKVNQILVDYYVN